MTSLRISDRVEHGQVGPCSLLVLPVAVPMVVRWHGSLVSHPDFDRGDELIQVVLASLLDKGTRHKDRFALSDELERRGAGISVASAGTRIEFRGRAMTRDFVDVMALNAEILREPSLDEGEFEKVKGRIQASLEQARDSTAMQADAALCRRLFNQRHPTYSRSVDEVMADLASMSIDAVRSYYQQHVGSNDLILSITGDVQWEVAERTVAASFAEWAPHTIASTHATVAEPRDPGLERIQMDNKPALDVRLGHAVPIARTDSEWLPLNVGVFMLGGNFSARLMRHIRDEMGLTYDINARLRGMQGNAQGYFATQMTLSQENLIRGIETTRQMIGTFANEGCSDQELDDTKTTMAGAYQVSLATTAALAARLHNNRVYDFPLEAIDSFVDEVAELTIERVRDTVARRVRPDELHTVMAGTVNDEE